MDENLVTQRLNKCQCLCMVHAETNKFVVGKSAGILDFVFCITSITIYYRNTTLEASLGVVWEPY